MAKKIIVCQTGARHRYLIPQVLERSALLYRLYTDTTAESFLGRLACSLKKIGFKAGVFSRICNRTTNIPRKKLYTTDLPFIKKKLFRMNGTLKGYYFHYTSFVKDCIRWDVGDADCVYSMFIENFEFLKYAKSKGLKVVVDIYECPLAYKFLIEEIKNNPEYSIFKNQIQQYEYGLDVRMHYMENLLKLADYYTIPSRFVIKHMSLFKNFDESKVKFLPYPSSIVPEKYDYHPVKHRLIWVGNDPVRKGLLYCAKAADILIEKYPDLDFRIIGVVNKELQESDAFRNLNFIGVLNKGQLLDEYRSAEAYVFPTLFEGFAGTVIEAASCGTPIITTENAGTDVKDFPAMYIPEKDIESIVNCVDLLFKDREYRNSLSKSVYNYAKNLKPEVYKGRLVNIIEGI